MFTEHLLCARPQDCRVGPWPLASLFPNCAALPIVGPSPYPASGQILIKCLLCARQAWPLCACAFLLCTHTPSGLSHLRLFLSPSLSSGPANRKQPERSRAAGPPEPSICTHMGLSAGWGGGLPVYENHKDPRGGASDRPPGSPCSLDLSPSQRGPPPPYPYRPQAASSAPGRCPLPTWGG